jgi:hypothetical protein
MSKYNNSVCLQSKHNLACEYNEVKHNDNKISSMGVSLYLCKQFCYDESYFKLIPALMQCQKDFPTY